MALPSSPELVVVGIDPGSQGAIIVLGSSPIHIAMMPTTTMRVGNKNRTIVDGKKLYDILWSISVDLPRGSRVIVEHLWSRPTDTPMTAWSLSERYNRVLQALDGLDMEYALVSPLRWKSTIMGTKDKWVGRKEASIEYIKSEHPTWPLRIGRQTTDQDGIADAYCLALYGQRLKGFIG